MHAMLLQSCLTVTLWTVAHQTPLSMVFPRQEYWSELPCPPPGDPPNPGIKPLSLIPTCIGRWVLYHQHHLGSPDRTQVHEISQIQICFNGLSGFVWEIFKLCLHFINILSEQFWLQGLSDCMGSSGLLHSKAPQLILGISLTQPTKGPRSSYSFLLM